MARTNGGSLLGIRAGSLFRIPWPPPPHPEEDVLLDALGVLSGGKRKWRWVGSQQGVPSEVT